MFKTKVLSQSGNKTNLSSNLGFNSPMSKIESFPFPKFYEAESVF